MALTLPTPARWATTQERAHGHWPELAAITRQPPGGQADF